MLPARHHIYPAGKHSPNHARSLSQNLEWQSFRPQLTRVATGLLDCVSCTLQSIATAYAHFFHCLSVRHKSNKGQLFRIFPEMLPHRRKWKYPYQCPCKSVLLRPNHTGGLPAAFPEQNWKSFPEYWYRSAGTAAYVHRLPHGNTESWLPFPDKLIPHERSSRTYRAWIQINHNHRCAFQYIHRAADCSPSPVRTAPLPSG